MQNRFMSGFFRSRRGQGIVEYVLILALFAVVLMMGTATVLKGGFGTAFNKYKNVLKGPYKY